MNTPKKDHYVSRTYLSNFALSDRKLIPYYKSGRIVKGKGKTPSEVCWSPNGDANPFFEDPRILDKYLSPLETAWASNVEAAADGSISLAQKESLAGYIAYLLLCNPVAIRLGQESISELAQPFADLAVRDFPFESSPFYDPNDPECIEVAKKLKESRIIAEATRDFTHFVGIGNLIQSSLNIYSCDWSYLSSPVGALFLTSDNPAIFIPTGDPIRPIPSIFVPLTPRLAIRIDARFDESMSAPPNPLEFDHCFDKSELLGSGEVKRLNTLIVQSAENLVLSSAECASTEKLVEQYRSWLVKDVEVPYLSERGLMYRKERKPVDSSMCQP